MDSQTRKYDLVYSVAPHQLDRLALSPDDRLLYFSLEETDGDIWLLSR